MLIYCFSRPPHFPSLHPCFLFIIHLLPPFVHVLFRTSRVSPIAIFMMYSLSLFPVQQHCLHLNMHVIFLTFLRYLRVFGCKYPSLQQLLCLSLCCLPVFFFHLPAHLFVSLPACLPAFLAVFRTCLLLLCFRTIGSTTRSKTLLILETKS